MNARLLVILGKTIKRQVALKLPAVVGRSRDADVIVTHPLVSRRHCEISENDGLLMLRDLGSLNGTMIGGRRFVVAPLLPGAEFTIGPLTFRVLYKYEGDLESVPATHFSDEGARTTEASLGGVAPVGSTESPVPQGNQTLSEAEVEAASSELLIGDFKDPGLLPASCSPLPAPDALDEPLEVDSSLQSGSHRKQSPWAIESPLVEDLRQMPLTSAEKAPAADSEMPPDAAPAQQAAKSPPEAKPPAVRPRKPSYGEEIDPEFGNFLEDLQ